jgi:hypothetical protein
MKWQKILTVVLVTGLLLITANTVVAAGKSTFFASLSGSEEVPPVETLTRGNVVFQLNQDRTELEYRLIVANIEDVTAAHIHMGVPGVNGPVLVTLYSGGLIEGRFNGILAQGVISGQSLGEEAFEDLLEMIIAGETYVNVHTTEFPGGEIRGQIR